MSDRNEYFRFLKESANSVRNKYKISSYRLLKSDLKRILKAEGVKQIIPLYGKIFKNIKGGYEVIPNFGPVVYIKDDLPQDPYAFTLAHELKHHLYDQDNSTIYCSKTNENIDIEIGAEIFAAELIFPEVCFVQELLKICKEKKYFKIEDLVHLKVKTKTTLSYQGLCKRLVNFKFAEKIQIKNIKWKKLELELYPNPFFKKKQRLTKE